MQNIKTNETGRSMVEMLGVLAVIGVLSVAGVAGYKAAVRKSLANNLLNQASMRATDVATKIGSGNLDALDSDSFVGNLGGGVTMSSAVKGPDGYADYDESDEQFTLTMEGVDEELCQQMQSMAGGSRSVVRAVLCDGDKAILTFNKDLSANPVSSDFDNNKEGCESSGRKYCANDTCIPATEECPNPCADVELTDCQQCNSFTGEIGYADNGKRCRIDDQKGTCFDGECRPISYCEKNGGVLKGMSNQFCHYTDPMSWLDAAKKCTAKENPTEADIKKYMPSVAGMGCGSDQAYGCEDRNLPYTIYWTSDCYDSLCEENYLSNEGEAHKIRYGSWHDWSSSRTSRLEVVCYNIDPEGYERVPDDCPSGTSSTGKGGEVSYLLDCYCPENKIWDSETSSCKEDDRPLYVNGENKQKFASLRSLGPYCPKGYHWASYSEFQKDFNCTTWDDAYWSYGCSENVYLSGILNSCSTDAWSEPITEVSCDIYPYSPVYLEAGGSIRRKQYGDKGYAICRRSE